MAKIKIEGQTLTMDDEIAKDDELLKAALVTSWPDAKTASFKREGGKDGAELIVTVQKKAGTKGGLIDRLFASPDGVNPAVVMSARIAKMARAGDLNPERVQELLPEIGSAAELGERDLDAANAALESLMGAGAIASKEVPLGF